MDWNAAARDVSWNIHPFIGGEYRPSSASERFDDIDPATETVLCQPSVGDASDVDAAVRVARERFGDGCWSDLPGARRGEVLMKLADLMVEHKAELGLLDTLEMGKPIQAAVSDAEELSPLLLRSWASFADKLVGASLPLASGSICINTYEPRGVVGAVTAWNFPSLNAVFKLGPALAAGNTVVLKPSELASGSALRIAELALEAGVPEGVLNVVPGLGATVGAALAEHRDVDMLSFTGSTTTGRKIMELSGRSNGKPVLLECGGKSPVVVFDDVEDLDVVADAVVEDVLWNSGQVCSAHTRLVVHERVHDALLERVVARARAVRPGDPLDERTTFGPLASPTQRDRVKGYVEAGLAAGADAALRGEVQETGGCYVSPTVFAGVDAGLSIVQQEIFGPVLCTQVFRDDDEAIALANGTDYGLVATVWTRDIGRGARAAHKIRAGGITVRSSDVAPGFDTDCILSYEPQKASGFGSETGLRGLQSYSTLKNVTLTGAASQR